MDLLSAVVAHELVVALVLEIRHHGIALRKVEHHGITAFRITETRQAPVGLAEPVHERRRTGGERRSDNDPLQTFDSDVNMDGVHGADDTNSHDDPYAHFMKDDDDDDDGGGGGGMNSIDTKKQKIDHGNTDKVFTNTKDGTGQSTAGRGAWKEKHKKGKFSSKKRLVDRKYKAPLGI